MFTLLFYFLQFTEDAPFKTHRKIEPLLFEISLNIWIRFSEVSVSIAFISLSTRCHVDADFTSLSSIQERDTSSRNPAFFSGWTCLIAVIANQCLGVESNRVTAFVNDSASMLFTINPTVTVPLSRL